MPKQCLRFGAFEFDGARSLLLRSDVPVAIGQRGASLLGAFLKRRGEVLSKADLMDAGWRGVSVEEANLSVQISQLRQALGRAPDGGEWITTVPRVGYRFAPEADAGVAGFRYPVLAILPFTDFGSGAEAEARGFTEDLTTAVSRLRSISVVARVSSFERRGRPRDVVNIARRLGADYVVEGSRRRTAAGPRTNVQLIEGTTGSHIWAQIFDHESEADSTADQLVHRVAALIEAKIHVAEGVRSQSRYPDNESAYDLYLRARRKFYTSTEVENAAAYGLLKRALQLEPDNIHIVGAAAGVLHHRISMGWPSLGSDDRAESLVLARRGVEMAGNDGAFLAMFPNALFTARDHDMGRATMDRAVELNRYSVTALCSAGLGYLFLGENDRADAYYEQAVALGEADPTLAFSLGGLASIQRRRGNYERAIELASRSVAVSPGYCAPHWHLIASSMRLGRVGDAKRYLARFRQISPNTTVSSIRGGQPVVDERLIEPLLESLAEAGLPEA